MVSLTELVPQQGWFKCLGSWLGELGAFLLMILTEMSVIIPCVGSSFSRMTCTYLLGSWFFSEFVWVVHGLFRSEYINLKISLLPYSTGQIKSTAQVQGMEKYLPSL